MPSAPTPGCELREAHNEPGYTTWAKQTTPTAPATTPRTVRAHITFDCPTHRRERIRLLGYKSTWEEVDTPNEIRVDVDINEYEDGVMLFLQ